MTKPALNLEALPKLYAAVKEWLELVEKSRPDIPARIKGFYEIRELVAACETQEGE